MTARPQVLAFDVIETLFSLEPLRQHFQQAGLPRDGLELWFATALRDMFALTACGSYSPMKQILESAADEVSAKQGGMIDKKQLIEAMGSLPAHADVAPGLEALKDAGFRMLALTNGSQSNTKKLLQGAGLSELFERLISTDDVKRAKPHPEVYLHAAREADVRPDQLMLIAAHPWDVHGTKRAGLMAAYLDRGKPYPDFMESPDLREKSLIGLAEGLSSLETGFIARAVEQLTD